MKRVSTQSTLLTCLVLSASAAFVSSCQDYEPYNDQHLKDVAYTHEFERQFGKIDPKQDWDLFGQLARRIGPMTRAGESEYPTISLWSDTVQISKETHDNYTLVLPEIGTANNSYANSNMGQVTQDFLSSARKIDFIPVHWTTSAVDSIGIYWYVDEDEWKNNTEVTTTIMGKDGHLYYIKKATVVTRTKTRLDIAYVSFDPNDPDNKDKWVETITPIPNNSTNVNDYFLNDAQMRQRNIREQYLVSHPYSIIIPNNIPEIGFWIHNQDGSDIRYSEWNLNPSVEPFEQGGTYKMSFVATFNLNGLNLGNGEISDKNQYICFEDWINGGDADLNDVIFIARGLDDTNIKDNDAITENALLVCEDLSSYDFDFNDVVLGLTYKEEDEKTYTWVPKQGNIAAHWEAVSTEAKSEKVIVTPMAAGGAFETNVTINNVSRGEIHTLLKESPSLPSNSRNHRIINAGSEYQAIADPITIDIPTNHQWNVGNGDGQYATHLSQLFLKENFFKLVSTDGDVVKIVSNISSDGSSSEGSYQEGKAPQMMLLPYYFEWPQEEVHISEAYNKDDSHGFENWVQDITKTNWIFDSQVSELVTDRGEFLPDTPEEEINMNLIEAIEVDFKDSIFVYGSGDPNIDNGFTFYNAIFIDLQGISPLLLDDAKATVIVHYTLKPANIYFDDADGNLLVYDSFGDGRPHTTTYTFSANRFNKAVNSGGMWLAQTDDEHLRISKVEIQLIGVTDPEDRHNLVVNPTSITFNEIGLSQVLTYSSSTHANVSFTTTDINVAQWRLNDNGEPSVYAQGVGTCEIIVTAEATTQYKANVVRIPVVVNPTLTLNLGQVRNSSDITVGSTTYTNIRRRNATTTSPVDLNDWSNGAKLTIHYTGLSSDEHPVIFRISNTSRVVIAGDYRGYKQYEHDVTFTLTKEQLATCQLNDDNTLSFRIEYNTFNNTPTISSVSLTKIAANP